MPDAPASCAIYALTPQGCSLARTLVPQLNAALYLPERMAVEDEYTFTSLRECLEGTFSGYDEHIVIAATGIVVRCIAPLLRSKTTDPAVVVLDQQGQFAISLLSGHLGGANALARTVARHTGGTPVITTATDTEGLPSMDMLAQKAGCSISNVEAVKHVNGALVAGEPVWIDDPADALELQQSPWNHLFTFDGGLSGGSCGTIVSWRTHALLQPEETVLLVHPPVLHLGVGCKKATSPEVLEQFVRQTLAEKGIAIESIKRIASVEAKADEPALHALKDRLRLPFTCFPAPLLDGIPVPNPSAAPKQAVDTASVAEAAALASCAYKAAPHLSGPLSALEQADTAGHIHDKGKLVLEKIKGNGVTLAVALEK